ncbi:hypothetical protein B0H12DRAFT_1144578 [Mycena haematopus]|nr:hypothetical protein B0H12DRAFT_1144578 [Mycena haematopus]
MFTLSPRRFNRDYESLSPRFRDIITSTPAFWTPAEADLDDEGSAKVFKLYLERLKNR